MGEVRYDSRAATWDGLTRPKDLQEEYIKTRHAVADAARGCEWERLLRLLSDRDDVTNTCRLGGPSLYTPLHQAAHGGAPIEVVESLLKLGAWRTLQNSRGERPVDVAERMGHRHLLDVLEPQYKRNVPLGVLLKIQSHFHAVIRGRVKKLVREYRLRLPELEPLFELEEPSVWFAVPGMTGGFHFWLESAGVAAKLISESWCRVVDGSGQRHEVDSAGGRLVAEGFV